MNRIACVFSVVLVLTLFVPTHIFANIKVVNLKTLYRTNPLGIDEKPLLSWQMTADADSRDVVQTAYQIRIAVSEEALDNGDYIYDTGKISDSHSVGIPYNGKLQPATRYHWKVRIWDKKGKVSEFSEAAWFETGLLSDDWNGASWIGSDKVLLSKYRSSYMLDFDLQIQKGSHRALFVFGKRTPTDYCTVELRLKEDGAELLLGHYAEGKEYIDAKEDVAAFITDMYGKQHITLTVFATQYCKSYQIDVNLNGNSVKNTHIDTDIKPKTPLEIALAGQTAAFTIAPVLDKPFYDSRLYEIGFAQPEGEKATFSNISISCPAWKTILYKDSKEYLATSGLQTWQPGEDIAAPMLRKDFRLKKQLKSARLYATARGIYECYINGQKISTDFMNPGWSDYRYRLFYNTYDVTDYLQEGNNAIGAILGNGWWSDFMGYQTYWQDQYGIKQSFLSKLHVVYVDGTQDVIVSDDTWTCFNDGPVRGNSMQNGEDYDATKEPIGWSMPGYAAAEWSKALVFDAPDTSIKLQAYVGDPIQTHETLIATSVKKLEKDVYIYDMGINMVGIPRIKLNGRKGQKLTIRYAEMLWPEIIPTQPVAPYTIDMYQKNKGKLYTDNYRSALSTDTYICKGGEETFEPRFTQHGFRYIQIEGIEDPLPLHNVNGLVMHAMAGGQTSHYETSNPLVNQLYQNILWGQKGNFLAVPTDCPQRDERLGYTGDGQIFALSATYNYNVAPFFHRWMLSIRDNQDEDGNFSDFSPKVATPPTGGSGGGVIGWSDAGIIIPWHIYQQYADKQILIDQYPAMKRYMDYLERKAEENLQPAGGLGDWLSYEDTNSQITNTAYYAYDAMLMQKIATALGYDADANHYARLYANIKVAFNDTFVGVNGKTVTPAGFKKGKWIPKTIHQAEIEDTQTSYVLPLKAGLFTNEAKAAQLLIEAIERSNGHLATGFIGTPYLNPVLSEAGHSEVAYTLFLNETFPSWLYPVTQGATTIWERWDSYTKANGFGPVDMNSFNHYSYGAVEEWMMQYTLGIRTDEKEPGYKHSILKPHIGGDLDYVRGSFQTVYGTIHSGWHKTEKGYIYSVTIPPNTTATLYLNGETAQLKSGTYQFEIE